jgi:peptidoglycan/xylan/chitin deacetylase (PgdA/CDA1 family)
MMGSEGVGMLPFRRHDSLALCYHAVSQGWPSPLAVTPRALEAQVSRFQASGYSFVTFQELVRERGSHGRRAAVTFDDAYTSVLHLASPVLDSLGVRATVFVPSGYIEPKRPLAWPTNDQWLGTQWESELMPLSWEELGQLLERGWDVGSHTQSHPHLTGLTTTSLQEELEASRTACEEHLDEPCITIAYPYGEYNEHVTAAARAAGYIAGATVPPQMTVRHPARDGFDFPRIGIYRGDSDRALGARSSRILRSLRGFPR